MSGQGGIGKSGNSRPNAPNRHEKLRDMEEAAVNGSLHHQKTQSAMQQASVSQPNKNVQEPMDETPDQAQFDEHEASSGGTQVYNSQAVMPSIETDRIPLKLINMKDALHKPEWTNQVKKSLD
ncbi:uncharacterized protein N7483_011513 [Penicillium malachiteum]|uniref:uncharacterized protein n=1 Tax=Penicillium malachiteum TaxID=1324776 RepID=UPI002547671A|nr:uncharacterized protein N7483_011513 [Penicillium malachiteum]KAJ5714332.1 hypothetical protein N7483_011513 [Penicillium malachiteum]